MTDDGARALFRGGSLLLVGLAVELGVSFGVKLLLARYLGRVDFGIVSIGMTLMTITATVVLAGLHTGVGRYLPRAETPRERNGIIVSALQIILPLSIAASVGVAVVATPLAEALLDDRALSWVILVFALGIPFNAVVRFANGTIQGTQKVLPRIYLQNIGLPVTRLGLLALAVVLGLGLSGVVAATVGAYIVISVYGLWFIIRSLSEPRTAGYNATHRELLSFSFPLLVTSAMLLVFSEIDTLMLGYFDLPGSVGDYRVVYPLAMLLLVVLRSFRFLFMPHVSELDASDETEAMTDAYAAVTKWVFVATIPVFVILISFPERIIALLFGAEYTGGTVALVVLCLGFVTHTVVGPNGTTLTSMGRTRTIMYDNIVVATLNTVLNLVLIPRYSILGAAIATAVAYAVINLLYSVQLYRALGIVPFPRDASRLYLFCLVGTGVLLWAQFFTPTLLRTVLSVGFLAVFPYAVIKLGGIGPREVAMLDEAGERVGLDSGRVRSVLNRVLDE